MKKIIFIAIFLIIGLCVKSQTKDKYMVRGGIGLIGHHIGDKIAKEQIIEWDDGSLEIEGDTIKAIRALVKDHNVCMESLRKELVNEIHYYQRREKAFNDYLNTERNIRAAMIKGISQQLKIKK